MSGTAAHEPISCSLPQGVWFTTEVASLLLGFLRKEMYDVSRTNRPRHVTRGWLHKRKFSERRNIMKSMCFHQDCMKSMGLKFHYRYLNQTILTISRWIEHCIAKRAERKSTFRTPDLQDLTPAILREFSSSTETLSTRQDDIEWCTAITIEAQDQDKFYRCFNKRAGRGVSVCTEWSKTADGRFLGSRPGMGSGDCSRKRQNKRAHYTFLQELPVITLASRWYDLGLDHCQCATSPPNVVIILRPIHRWLN